MSLRKCRSIFSTLPASPALTVGTMRLEGGRGAGGSGRAVCRVS